MSYTNVITPPTPWGTSTIQLSSAPQTNLSSYYGADAQSPYQGAALAASTPAGMLAAGQGTDPGQDLQAGNITGGYAQNTASANQGFGAAGAQGGQAAQQGYGALGNAAALLGGLATGKGPSLGALQTQQGIQAANRAIQSGALSNQGGMSPGLTQFNTANAQANADANIAAQGAQTAAQQQLGAINALGGVGGQLAGTGVNQQLGGYGGQAGLAGTLAGLQNQQYGTQQGQSLHWSNALGSLTPLGGGFLNGVGAGIAGG